MPESILHMSISTNSDTFQERRNYHRRAFGQQLARFRSESRPRLSQAALAQQLGVDVQTVIRLESGRAPVELDVVEAVGRILGTGIVPFLESLLPAPLDEMEVVKLGEASLTNSQFLEYESALKDGELLGLMHDIMFLPLQERRFLATLVASRAAVLSPARARLSGLLRQGTEIWLRNLVALGLVKGGVDEPQGVGERHPGEPQTV